MKIIKLILEFYTDYKNKYEFCVDNVRTNVNNEEIEIIKKFIIDSRILFEEDKEIVISSKLLLYTIEKKVIKFM